MSLSIHIVTFVVRYVNQLLHTATQNQIGIIFRFCFITVYIVIWHTVTIVDYLLWYEGFNFVLFGKQRYVLRILWYGKYVINDINDIATIKQRGTQLILYVVVHFVRYPGLEMFLTHVAHHTKFAVSVVSGCNHMSCLLTCNANVRRQFVRKV